MGCPVARATPAGGLVDSTRHLSDLGTGEMTPQPQRPVLIESPILEAADAQEELPTHEGADDKVVAPSKVNRLDEVRFAPRAAILRSEEHTSELQSRENLVCRLLLVT